MKSRVSLDEFRLEIINDVKVYVANSSDLASQGLAGATREEFDENSIMLFPKVYDKVCSECSDIDFDNEDHCYGPVSFDIEIAFLNINLDVLAIEPMEAKIGKATPPPGTKIAIETLPNWFTKHKFVIGRPIPDVWVKPLQRILGNTLLSAVAKSLPSKIVGGSASGGNYPLK